MASERVTLTVVDPDQERDVALSSPNRVIWPESGITKAELAEYLTEVSGEQGAWMRPSFWPTTHDILPPYLQATGVRGFAVRAVLAALGAPTWGIYSGYELVEDVPRPGVDEQIDNEKYEFKPRDWSKADAIGINLLLGRLNELRHTHPALQQLRNLRVHSSDDDAVLVFTKLAKSTTPGESDDAVIVVVNTDPHGTRETMVHLNMPALGLDWHDQVAVHDEITDETWTWGERNYVRLDPYVEPAHVLTVRRPHQ
jgi:starch synthase (maltosyl-transferring)